MALPALTPDARSLADALVSASHDALLVGGAVRDWLLDRDVGDLDLVTDASPDDVRELTRGAAWARGTYAIGERFGTIGVVLADGRVAEISRYRDPALGRASAAERFQTDAGHRDFTVNAIAFDLSSGDLLDPMGGRADLSAGLLRCPGEPAERLAEDPVRVLRAARFTAQLGFSLEPATRAALPDAAPMLREISVERVRDELTRLLVAPHAPIGLEVLRDTGALAVVLPEIAALDGLTQPTFHDLDVLSHTIEAVGLAPPTPGLRWATLLHDAGKGPTRTIEPDGRIRFFRHAKIGAELAETVCERLRFSRADSRAIVHLVAEHMRLGDTNLANPRSVDRAVRKLDLPVASADPPRMLVTAEDALEIVIADFAATAHRAEAPELRRRLENAIAASRRRGTAASARSTLSGHELMRELGIDRGKQVGRAKRAIESAVHDGDLAQDDRAGALRIARQALGYDSVEATLEPDDEE